MRPENNSPSPGDGEGRGWGGLGMVHKKKKDISTMYTKYKNKSCGRTGYYCFREKVDVISPRDYGMFLKQGCKK